MTTSKFKINPTASSADGAQSNADTQAGLSNNVNSLARRESDDPADWSSSPSYRNPFIHRFHIGSRVDWARIYILTVLLVPFRVIGCVLSLLSAWMFASIGLYGIDVDDLSKQPLAGWRKKMQYLAAFSMRMVYASGSFHYITFKGRLASPKEAPILVVAPHSSYVDSIVVVVSGPPSIVAKRETADIPVLGKIINIAQPIYVQREDPNSRVNTIREIERRARSEENWPQVVIFAEGTCTNRSALIKFKPGAFYPGVPVQPILLKYPNKYDTFTWTWDGPSVWNLLWLTMASFYNKCEIEYLPVYHPSEEEKNNANLYAKNVRAVMAKALGVPTSEYSFEDISEMNRAKEMRIPYSSDIVEIGRLLLGLGLLESSRDSELVAEFASMSNTDKLDIITFSELIKADLKNTYLHQLFTILDHRRLGIVNLRRFLLCSLFCKMKNMELIHFLRAITPLYAESSNSISREGFVNIFRHSGKLTEEKWSKLFFAIDRTNKGYISFDDFVRHTSELGTYSFLYKKRDFIRGQFNKK